MIAPLFDLQGHRGARGLKPENTLPGFEIALDLGVTSLETDLHLTADQIPVLYHDDVLSERLCSLLPGAPALDLSQRPHLSTVTLAQLRRCRANRNPDPHRFPDQEGSIPPLAQLFAAERGIDPYTPPTLAELFAFADAYASDLGRRAGKTEGQCQHARRLRFDLELKRVPFRPGIIGDSFDGTTPGRLEETVVEEIRRADVAPRTVVRSFDHRSVQVVGRLLPELTRAVLVAGTALIAPAEATRRAGAQVYCPDVEFLDETQVRQAHEQGVRVVPWTVNTVEDWRRLLDWGVDGITTDFPDRLAALLGERGVRFNRGAGQEACPHEDRPWEESRQ